MAVNVELFHAFFPRHKEAGYRTTTERCGHRHGTASVLSLPVNCAQRIQFTDMESGHMNRLVSGRGMSSQKHVDRVKPALHACATWQRLEEVACEHPDRKSISSVGLQSARVLRYQFLYFLFSVHSIMYVARLDLEIGVFGHGICQAPKRRPR